MTNQDTHSLSGRFTRRPASSLVGPLIALVTIIIVLAGIELVAYLWEKSTAQGPQGWTLVASRRMPLDRYGDADRPYYLMASGEDYYWEGIPVQINNMGLRTNEFSIPKPPDVYRILNVGDSIAFGWEVRQEETYGERLASLLNERNDGRTYEVINAGVPAWNLTTARNFLLQKGLEYEPDLVLLDITVANDIRGKGPESIDRIGLFDWLRDNTYAWPFLTTQFRFLLAGQSGPEAIPVLNPSKDADWYFPLSEEDKTWDQLWSNIAEMHQASQKEGAEFLVVVFPTALQLNSSNHPNVPQQVFSVRAKEAGIKIIDLLPIYRQTCEQAEYSACEGLENILFGDVWMHPTSLGHKLAAQQIEKVLSASDSN